MDELAERIKASLEDPSGEPWFPELTADLAARAWEKLQRDIGLTQDTYSTERVLSRSISPSREIITYLKICPAGHAAAPAIPIEALTDEFAIKYREQGISFYSPDEILNTTIRSCLEDALAIINQVPSLMRTVAALVRCLHVIKPEGADYDVSFSEPHIPFSIFVSVPEKRIANDQLRVAEAIVHEAMHLQLTLIEGVLPIVAHSPTRVFSPWRGQYRTVQGVFHALYVFRVIDRALQSFSSLQTLPAYQLIYIVRRRSEIAVQARMIQSFEDRPDLTRVGASLARTLIYR